MKILRTLIPGIASAILFMACGNASDANASNTTTANTMTQQTADTASVRVAVRTTAGNFTVLLYGDTPPRGG